MYLASRIGVASHVSTISRASSMVMSVAPSARTFAPLCSRVARQRDVRAHRRADAPDLVRRDRRAQTGAVDRDPRVRFASRDGESNGGRDVRIIDSVGGVGAAIVDGDSLLPKMLHERALQRDAGVVAAYRDAARRLPAQGRKAKMDRSIRRARPSRAAREACPAPAASRGRREPARRPSQYPAAARLLR